MFISRLSKTLDQEQCIFYMNNLINICKIFIHYIEYSNNEVKRFGARLRCVVESFGILIRAIPLLRE
jgi:hypothetical protein